MKPHLAAQLSALGPLNPANALASRAVCKICRAPAPFCDLTDFYKTADGHQFGASGVAVPWYRCRSCDFLFTTFFDDWSQDEFTRYVYNEDYLKVDPEYVDRRPERSAGQIEKFLFGRNDISVLDYGSGAGVFVNCMNRHGFNNVTGYDPFSSPERPRGMYDIVTCIEVIEHSPDPINTFADMVGFLAPNGCILVGEAMQPANIEDVRANWWYCAPRNGHCSTFSQFTFTQIARTFGFAYHRQGTYHLFRRLAGEVGLASALGPRVDGIILTAPQEDSAGWHLAERAFRWSSQSELRWQVPGGGEAALIEIRIPYVMEIEAGFVERCGLYLGGSRLELQNTASRLIVGSANHDGTDVDVVLQTPAPLRPADRGGRDERALGLAVCLPPLS